MTATHSKPGTSLDQTNCKKTTSNREGSNPEAPWQQLTFIIYVMHELADAMEQERAANKGTPMNKSWQQFLSHLQKHKPKLFTTINAMLQKISQANEATSNV